MENLHQKCMTPLCVQSETESHGLWDTVQCQAGQVKPHMQRDALPKAHPNTVMGNLKNRAESHTR